MFTYAQHWTTVDSLASWNVHVVMYMYMYIVEQSKEAARCAHPDVGRHRLEGVPTPRPLRLCSPLPLSHIAVRPVLGNSEWTLARILCTVRLDSSCYYRL